MIRSAGAVHLLLLLVLLFSSPSPAQEKPKDEVFPVQLQADIGPRSHVAFRLDGERNILVPERGNFYAPLLLPQAKEVLGKVPPWLRVDLERKLRRLPYKPLQVEPGSVPMVGDVTGDGLADLLIHDPARGTIRLFTAPNFREDRTLFADTTCHPGPPAALISFDDDGILDLICTGKEGNQVILTSPGFNNPVPMEGEGLKGCSWLSAYAIRQEAGLLGSLLIGGFPTGEVRALLCQGGKFGETRNVVLPQEFLEKENPIAGIVEANLVGDDTMEVIAWTKDGRISAFSGPGMQESVDLFQGFRIRKGSLMGAGDLTGDGQTDLVVIREDGSVRLTPNRGTSASPWFPQSEMEVESLFGMEPETLTRPALADLNGDGIVDLLVGRKDGTLRFYAGPEFTPEEHPLSKMTFTGCAAPALGDLNGDDKADLAVGEEGGKIHVFLAPHWTQTEVKGLEQGGGEFPVPAIGDADGDGNVDLVIGRFDGKVRLFLGGKQELQFSPAPDDHPLCQKSFGRSAAPALADLDGDGVMDLIMGNQKGRVTVLRGPNWTDATSGWFGEGDVGEMSSPATADLDGDSRADVALGCVRGEISFYRNEGTALMETRSWTFDPSHDHKTLGSWTDQYHPVSLPFLALTDEKTLDAVVGVIEGAESTLRDEVAFAVAHTPAETVRAMVLLGDADLFLVNASAIREMAGRLSYVEMVQENEMTTLEYTRANGAKERIPPPIYYWWVVHPRILYEIPSRIDTSWWTKSPEERGMDKETWLKHEPDRSVYEHSSASVFWRSSLPSNRFTGKSLFEAAGDAKTLEEAVLKIDTWLSPGHENSVMTFGYLTGDLQPLVIFQKRYGSCGEHSCIGAACARSLLIPTSVVTDRGEDHQWNEFWMGGSWHHWDLCGGGNIDRPWGSTEGREHKGKTVTAVLRWRGDDLQEATTTTVAHPDGEGEPYTSAGTGYTDTARVDVKVEDAQGKPVDGALVIVKSHWNHRNMIGHWGYTGPDGIVPFDLGYQANGGYTLEILSLAGCGGIRNFPVEEGKRYGVTVSVPGSVPGLPPIQVKQNPAPEGMKEVTLTLKNATPLAFPKNLLTGIKPVKQDDPKKRFVFRTTGYRGTVNTEWPLAGDPILVAMVFDEVNFALFREGRAATALEAVEPTGAEPVVLRVPLGGRVVLLNQAAFTSARVCLVGTTRFEPQPPTIELAAASVQVPTGGFVEIGGTARDNAGIAALEWTLDGGGTWHDATSLLKGDSTFVFPWHASAGGPLPPGRYEMIWRVQDVAGATAQEHMYADVVPALSFTAQPIRQDNTKSPLPKSSWILGPFTVSKMERFLDVTAKGSSKGFDMDMFLFYDKNGNGRLDGMGEKAADSTSPLSSERIYLDLPKEGMYWVFCQGWKVEGETAPLDVKISFLPRFKIVTDFHPVGFVKEKPTEIRCSINAPSGIAPGSIRVLFDGKEISVADRFKNGTLLLDIPWEIEEGRDYEVEVHAKDRAGNSDKSRWTFELDTAAPNVTTLKPDPGQEAGGKFEVKAKVAENRNIAFVEVKVDDGKHRRMKPVEEEEGVYTFTLDASGWKPGEHVIRITARDKAGNEDYEDTKVTVPKKGE